MKNNFKIISVIIFFYFFNTNHIIAQVVYLDLDKIMRVSAVGKSLNNYINQEQKKIFETFKLTESDFKEQERQILSKKNILKKEEIEKKIAKLQEEVTVYNRNKKKTLQELQKKKMDLTKKVIDNLNPILTTYMEENSISLVVRKKDIIVGKNSLNITDNIILLLDKKIKKINN